MILAVIRLGKSVGDPHTYAVRNNDWCIDSDTGGVRRFRCDPTQHILRIAEVFQRC